MLRDEFVQKTYQAAVGKPVAPDSSNRKFLSIVLIANTLIPIWQNELNTDWESLKDEVTLPDPISTTDTYALPATVRKLSKRPLDKVVLTKIDGEKVYLNNSSIRKAGSNLIFGRTFDASSDLIGATITVKFYGFAPLLTSNVSVVKVDDPAWLIYMTAAEYARNDYIKQNQNPNLVAMANEVMKAMKHENKRLQSFQLDQSWSPFAGN